MIHNNDNKRTFLIDKLRTFEFFLDNLTVLRLADAWTGAGLYMNSNQTLRLYLNSTSNWQFVGHVNVFGICCFDASRKFNKHALFQL